MHRHLFLVILILFKTTVLPAQTNPTQWLNQASGTLTGSGLSNDQIIKGLKEALSIGTGNSTEKASKRDGYYKNPQIKIPFPKEARDMEKTLRSLGMNKQADDFVKSMNRAAEDAAKKAAPIFLNAISKMNIQDGLAILKANTNAATEYLRKTTSLQLKAEFKPVIKASLEKVEVTKYWNSLASSYNKIPFTKKVNPKLEEYVTDRALEGLFKLLAEEEAKIRKDPQAQVTNLLKQVFGGG
jgi:hypothetical protein